MLKIDKVLHDLEAGTEGLGLSEATEKLSSLHPELVLNVLPENDPDEGDTIGQLCNKLSCVTIQMWHNQESLYKIRKMDVSDFIIDYKDQLPELHETIKRCCDLNVQRAQLMDAIDKAAVELSKGNNGHTG